MSRLALLALVAAVGCGSGSDSPDAIAELFAGTCAGAGCHVDTDAPAEGLDLSSGALCAELIGVPSAQNPQMTLVAPGSPEASYLLCKLEPECAERGATARMPLGSGALDQASIDLVASWIADGAPGCAAADDTAPVFDGAASATGLTSAIQIEWSPASDDTTAAGAIVYEIYEADSPGGQDFSSPTYVSEPGATSHIALPLPISTTRYYVVRARDGSGNTDDNQVEVSATTLETADQTPPEFAGLESATPAGSTGLALSWSPASDDITPPEQLRYRAYVAAASGAQSFDAPAGESEPGATELVVSGLDPETDYFVVVRAVDVLENEETNTVERQATTGAAIRFSADVQPIFDASCTGNACHGGIMPAENLDLTAGVAHGELVGIPAGQCGDRLRVAPGNPDASYLIAKLRGVDLCSGTRMPKTGSLPASQIQTIADWIAQGALDN